MVVENVVGVEVMMSDFLSLVAVALVVFFLSAVVVASVLAIVVVLSSVTVPDAYTDRQRCILASLVGVEVEIEVDDEVVVVCPESEILEISYVRQRRISDSDVVVEVEDAEVFVEEVFLSVVVAFLLSSVVLSLSGSSLG